MLLVWFPAISHTAKVIMNKYLEKLASDSTKDSPGYGLATAGAIGTGVLTDVLAYPLQLASYKHLLTQHENPSSSNIGDGSTAKKFIEEHGLNLDINHDASNKGPHFRPLRKSQLGTDAKAYLQGSHNHGIMMHELGHALDFKHKSMEGLVAKRFGSGVVGLGVTIHGVKNGNAGEAASGMGLMSAHKLLGEAVANKHAYSAFKKHEGSVVANKFLRKIVLPNTINYHSPVIAGALGAAALTKYLHRNDK